MWPARWLFTVRQDFSPRPSWLSPSALWLSCLAPYSSLSSLSSVRQEGLWSVFHSPYHSLSNPTLKLSFPQSVTNVFPVNFPRAKKWINKFLQFGSLRHLARQVESKNLQLWFKGKILFMRHHIKIRIYFERTTTQNTTV